MQRRTPSLVAEDALKIWQAGVNAVASDRLIANHVDCWKSGLSFDRTLWRAAADSQICVVGAGKAGAGMAAGLERKLGSAWLSRTTGFVNVPDDCVRPLQAIHLHPSRPAGRNEPTEQGVQGTEEILHRVSQLREQDLCLVLLSGGGSALLPAPVDGITLADKLQVTRSLSRTGATISELTCVRRAISRVKGGGLLRACRAGLMVSLIISDVIGDPLDVIASGPTVDLQVDCAAALKILRKLESQSAGSVPESVMTFLQQTGRSHGSAARHETSGPLPRSVNLVIGNNKTAVTAAAEEARRQGYSVPIFEWDQPGIAADCGRKLARALRQLNVSSSAPAKAGVCLISGGEPTVQLAETPGQQKGGRNQELVLAATAELMNPPPIPTPWALLSGGTDGEDGPTDAAGAIIDSELLETIRSSQVDLDAYLSVNNSYPFFDQFGALLKTGPTHTNVMDLRVAVCPPGEH